MKTGNGGAPSMTPITSGLLSTASCRKPSMSRNGATQKQNLKQSPALLASQRIVDRQAWELGGASSLKDARILEDACYAMDTSARTNLMRSARATCTPQNVTQARCKEIIDDPPYKLYVDTGRKRSNNYPLNYPQPTEIQKAKLREYDQKVRYGARRIRLGFGSKFDFGAGDVLESYTLSTKVPTHTPDILTAPNTQVITKFARVDRGGVPRAGHTYMRSRPIARACLDSVTFPLS